MPGRMVVIRSNGLPGSVAGVLFCFYFGPNSACAQCSRYTEGWLDTIFAIAYKHGQSQYIECECRVDGEGEAGEGQEASEHGPQAYFW